jgi:hypothetical protein
MEYKKEWTSDNVYENDGNHTISILTAAHPQMKLDILMHAPSSEAQALPATQ